MRPGGAQPGILTLNTKPSTLNHLMPLTLADTLPTDANEREYLWTLNFGPQHPATHMRR